MPNIHRQASSIMVLISLFLMASPVLADKAPEIPPGTTIKIRMIDKLNSEEAQMGDLFHATLEEPISVDGHELYPRGSDVTGKVADVHKSGSLSDPGELDLVLKTVTSGRITSSLRVEPLIVKGESHGKSNVAKIGGGAALGAVIGAIAGGGKGAAIGAGVGGAAGTGAAAATGKKPATVSSETVLAFVTVTPTAVSGDVTASRPPTRPEETSSVPGRDDSGVAPARLPSDAGAPPNDAGPPPNDSAPSPSDNGPDYGSGTPQFSLRDRRVIRNCAQDHAADFPAGTLTRPPLPPGSDRDIRRGGTMAADVQRNAQPLPLVCEQQLPKLPGDTERVVYNGRVLLVDASGRILDLFVLNDNQ